MTQETTIEGAFAGRANAAAGRFLHVANGTSTTRLVRAAAIPGSTSIWADPLYEGPVPGGLADPDLLAVRAAYLAAPAEEAALDPVNDLREWRAAIDRHASYDELILWFEHDLFDQLNLVQVLCWIGEHLPATKPVSLVCIGSFPNHPGFKGLGELTPGELASLLGTRQRVGEAQYEVATRAWHAFRSPTPEPLEAFRHTDSTVLPYLAAAIERFLQEYPWTGDGLSRTERRLMQLADAGAIELSSAFPRMHDGEDAYYVTDCSLGSLAGELSRTSPALLTIGPGQPPLHRVVTLTDFGRAVLTGEQDRVASCGIDRWLGGVHLQGRSQIWRWDSRRQAMVQR